MGSAERQGDLWSANPAGWAEQAEAKQRPLYEAVLDRLDPPPGTALLGTTGLLTNGTGLATPAPTRNTTAGVVVVSLCSITS